MIDRLKISYATRFPHECWLEWTGCRMAIGDGAITGRDRAIYKRIGREWQVVASFHGCGCTVTSSQLRAGFQYTTSMPCFATSLLLSSVRIRLCQPSAYLNSTVTSGIHQTPRLNSIYV